MNQASYQDLGEIKSLVNQFVTKSLPAKDWTHHAHLTVGLWFIANHGMTESSSQIPNLIRKYNESLGNLNTDTSGYHETITQFWLWSLNCYWQQVKEKMSLLNACNYLVKSPFGNPESYLIFYSKSHIFSSDARGRFVEPDIQPLDSRFLGAGV